MRQTTTPQRQFERRTLDVRLDLVIDERSRKQVAPLTGLTLSGKLKNVSRGGAYLIVATFLPRGTQVSLEIPAGGAVPEGRVAARVVNVKMIDREPRYGLGVRFEEPDSEYVRRLVGAQDQEVGG